MATILGKRVKTSATQAGGGKIPHTAKARAPFFFMTHPRAWSYDPIVDAWVPRLKRHVCDPGVNSIRGDRNPAQAYTEREQHGFTVVKPEDPRLGEKYIGYMLQMPYAGNGLFCVSMFESVEVTLGGHVFIERDDEAYAEFRQFLLDSGIVPPLDPRWRAIHLRAMAKTLSRRRSVASNAMPGSPAHDKLKAYEKLYAAAQKAGAPAPKKPARKPRKAPATRRARKPKAAPKTAEGGA